MASCLPTTSEPRGVIIAAASQVDFSPSLTFGLEVQSSRSGQTTDFAGATIAGNPGDGSLRPITIPPLQTTAVTSSLVGLLMSDHRAMPECHGLLQLVIG